MSNLLWGGLVAAVAVVVGGGVWWVINRGDPHQRPWKKTP